MSLDGPLRPDRRARRAAADRARRRPGQGSVLHARDRRSRAARPGRFPLGGQGKRTTRDEAAAAGLAVAERAESQEACFLAGDDYRTFLERQGLARRPARSSTRTGRARPPRRRLALHAGAAARDRARHAGAGLRARADTTTNTLTVGPRRALEVRDVSVRGRLYLPVERAEAKLRYRSDAVPALVEPTTTDSAPPRAARVRGRAGSGGRPLRR